MPAITQHGLKKAGTGGGPWGVVSLLASVRPSLSNYCGDDTCGALIDECLAHFEKRHGVRPVWTAQAKGYEPSFAALVRLLLYVRAEMLEDLREERCANLIQGCIECLLRSHLHWQAHENVAPGAPFLVT